MEKNILLTIEYDGTNFFGWQRQQGLRTVQGEVEKALSKVCGYDVKVNGTSRTDAGVHALGQRASFCGDFGIPVSRLQTAVNNMLTGGGRGKDRCPDVRITDVQQMPMDFHARFNSNGKKYRYIIRNKEDFDIFRKNYCYQVRTPLDADLMKAAMKYVTGTHDFACFQSAGGTPRETTVRTVHALTLEKDAREDLIIEVAGDGFLYNMVRIIVGTLIEVGQGKISPEAVEDIIASADRRLAGPTAPPQGLYLVEVYYDFNEREAANGECN